MRFEIRRRHLPIKQPSFPFQRPDSSHILADLKASLVDVFIVPDRKIPDIDELAPQLDPEVCTVLLPIPETVQDLLNYMHAGRGMAVDHLAADDPGTPGKDPLRLGRVVKDLVIRVHEGDVHREAGQDKVEMFWRKASR